MSRYLTMHFSIDGGGLGLLGGWILFGALMLAFTIVVTIVVRAVRGRDDTPESPDRRAPEDDYIL